MLTHKERIRAFINNLKNNDWTVNSQFRVEQKDAEALQDLEALKEYIYEKENPREILNGLQ